MVELFVGVLLGLQPSVEVREDERQERPGRDEPHQRRRHLLVDREGEQPSRYVPETVYHVLGAMAMR